MMGDKHMNANYSKNDDFEIYRHLKKNASEDTFRFKFNRLLEAEVLAKRILPFSQRANMNLTLHDAKHSERVIENVNRLMDIMEDANLNETEIEILYIAAWYHDIGLLKAHNTYSPVNKDKPKHG